MERIAVGLFAALVALGGAALADPAAAATGVGERLIVRSEGSTFSEKINDVRGREVGGLVVHPAAGSSLSVSPNGRRFAYVEPEVLAEHVSIAQIIGRSRERHRRVALRRSAIVVGSFLRQSDLPGGSAVLYDPRAVLDRVVGRPAWAPGGARLVAGRRTASGIHLVVVGAAGRSHPRRLTGGEGQDTNPAWSPTGRAIAFERRGRAGTDVFAVGPDGTHLRNLTGWRGEERWPSWSPDGRSIAFASNGSGLFRLYTLDVASGAVRRIETGGGNATLPRWSPDGRSLAFVSDADGDSDVRIVDLASRTVTAVTHNATEDRLEDWQRVGDTRPPVITVRPTSVEGKRVRLTATVHDRSDRVLATGAIQVSGGFVDSGFSSVGHVYLRTGRPPLRIAEVARRDQILFDYGESTSDVDLASAHVKHCVSAVDLWGNTAERCAPIHLRNG